jgi:hypothetical protein
MTDRPDPEEDLGPRLPHALTTRAGIVGGGAALAVADLPTSDWEPGDYSMQALITGVLEVDDDGCLLLRSQEGFGSFYAVWPHGYTATRTDGAVTLFDAAGRPVAVEGQAIRAGGGEVPRERVDLDSDCLPDTGDVTLIQSSVTVDDLGP